jgi:hypothetical protein
MSIRKGYIYALLLAIGFLLWTYVIDVWQKEPQEEAATTVAVSETASPWTSTEVVYECGMKAQELNLTVESMYTAKAELQGSLVLTGSRENLQEFYTWLENEGRMHQIKSFQLSSEDEQASQLSISYYL